MRVVNALQVAAADIKRPFARNAWERRKAIVCGYVEFISSILAEVTRAEGSEARTYTHMIYLELL